MLRRNPETAADLYAVAIDALKEAKMRRGPAAKELRARARAIYQETIEKFPQADVPAALNVFHQTGRINIDEIAELFDLPTYERISDLNSDMVWEMADQRIGDQVFNDEDEQDEARMEQQRDIENEYVFVPWFDGVIQAATHIFNAHNMDIVPIGKPPKVDKLSWRPYEWKVVPWGDPSRGPRGRSSWQDAAEQLIETINGVGTYDYPSVKAFVASKPYASAKEAVLDHLHWMKRWSEVYGAQSARSIYDRAWR